MYRMYDLPLVRDTTPLFQGLQGNLCQCPHWGFVLRGQLTTTDAEDRKETVKGYLSPRLPCARRDPDTFCCAPAACLPKVTGMGVITN